jgi:cobyrinic acid a,c-diamide synthase
VNTAGSAGASTAGTAGTAGTARLVIAAPASGSGKTTVATGLMAAFRARGLTVSGHKAGPDYIDPGYHAIATGRPGRNLDPFLCGERLIAPLFARGALHPAAADIAVIEGVMGLFDGADGGSGGGSRGGSGGGSGGAAGVGGSGAPAWPGDFASTAHIAWLLRAPVVLVVDAARAGRSVAAVIAGFAGFDPRVPVAGVIFNRVGSDRHERLLRDAAEPLGIPVFGAIRRTDAAVTPSRHLGLVPAAERLDAARRLVAALGSLVASSCDLPGLQALAASAPPLPVRPWEPDPAGPGAAGRDGPDPVIAVAQGPAFTFSYAEHAELLEAAGARVTPFDPLNDEALPPGTAGLVIGGGFPEVHAEQLSANAALRHQVRALASSGAPVVAECAGLLYLARTLNGLPMCGVIEAETRMTGRLTLGYRSGEAVSDSVLARSGEPVRGHEFHRTAADPAHGPSPAWRWPGSPGAPARMEGHVRGNVIASYLHVHWASRPAAARRLVGTCQRAGAHPPAPVSGARS